MSSPSVSDPSLSTEALNAPVTLERKLNLHLQEQLPEPYLARALAAVDPSHPKGTEGKETHNMSVLQQHVAYFDKNGDGIVYPWDTYRGFRAIGCGVLLSLASAIIINLAFSYLTIECWIPSPFLPIHIKNIHKCKHGSDTETYDTEGRFAPEKFDAIFSKYALTYPDALTRQEIFLMLRANRNFMDFIGWLAALAEWLVLYLVAKDAQGLLQRETVRGVYDGSLFEQLERRNGASKKKRT